MQQAPLTQEVETRFNGQIRILVFSLETQTVYVNGYYESINCYEFDSALTEKRNGMTYEQFIFSCK